MLNKSSLPHEKIVLPTGNALQTGDVLLCSGNGVLSKGIQKYQEVALRLGVIPTRCLGRDWALMLQMSHVAAISGGCMIAEATTINKWAVGPDGKPKRGYQLNPFDTWLKNYDGRVWSRKLIPPTGGWAYDYQTELAMQDESLIGTPYENGIPGGLELFFCGFNWFRNQAIKRLQTKIIHCTEGRGNVMQECDILSRQLRTNKIPPCMWGEGGKVDQNMINGFSLGPMVRVK